MTSCTWYMRVSWQCKWGSCSVGFQVRSHASPWLASWKSDASSLINGDFMSQCVPQTDLFAFDTHPPGFMAGAQTEDLCISTIKGSKGRHNLWTNPGRNACVTPREKPSPNPGPVGAPKPPSRKPNPQAFPRNEGSARLASSDGAVLHPALH